MSLAVLLGSLFVSLAGLLLVSPYLLRAFARVVGFSLRRASQGRRELLLARTVKEKAEFILKKHAKGASEDEDWERVESSTSGSADNGKSGEEEWTGVIGFFHPFCNAGGGGERVLWAAILAIQKRWPGAICVVYTGDHDMDKQAMLERVKDRFNIHIYPPTVHFLYLTTRRYVLSSTWPHFTLLGQSLGSLFLAYDAFTLLVPDIFIDTMGYAFALALSRYFFPRVPIGAYVHYPTISTDMLSNLSADSQGIHAGAGVGIKGAFKRYYWQRFAGLYSWAGGHIDVVMANSTWTAGHLRSLWSDARSARGLTGGVAPVFPPVAVEELAQQIEVSAATEADRGPFLLYIAQFRPEKNHTLILEAFAALMERLGDRTTPKGTPRLVLIGSVRDGDDASRVYQLRILAHELQIKTRVEFICDASWPQILAWLRRASIGVNSMWNEHFGIGVVEYQAAGLISVVNDSGGPKLDIVVDVDGRPTGFHASTAEEYARAFEQALLLGEEETLAMRRRARKSAERFTEEAFARGWVLQMEKLVRLQVQRAEKQHAQ